MMGDYGANVNDVSCSLGVAEGGAAGVWEPELRHSAHGWSCIPILRMSYAWLWFSNCDVGEDIRG